MRRAKAGDGPALALVAAATFLESYHAIVAGADMLAHLGANASPARFDAWMADAASRVLIAEGVPGAAPLGYAVLTAPDLPVATGAGDVELRRIYALAPFQGRGLGHALMTGAIAAAGSLGADRILLGVHGGNRRAQAFYERQGFVVAGERRFRIGEVWHDDLVYARVIAASAP